ncbi:hypothetical protein CU254_28225 [Amycolatopsis sp. AA4]|uniref:hypothetical protein n=1 Tax=Actinomycetes TaxID=1760 RepID=UPI0001B5865B|nr:MULTISPECIES: hypothetical protein [Actinomycetes]ATY13879.1 hypothetical protein CU254_28225 [Amycolatopsis sp. AA4]EFL09885.1 predicted protein [Streptomyces sp. AA4]
MTTAAAAPAPRHRSILVLLLTALLLLGVAVPGPGPAGPRPHEPESALVQEQGPHLVAAHPLPFADAPGEIRLARPDRCTVPFSVAPPVELDRAPAPAAARAPPDC